MPVGASGSASSALGMATVGASGAVAEQGLAAGSADPFGYTLCLLAMATFIAFKLREAGVMTFVDFFRQRFGPTASTLAAVLSIPSSLFWASAQLLGQSAGDPVRFVFQGEPAYERRYAVP